MFDAVKNSYLVPYDHSFHVSTAPTTPPEDAPGKNKCKKKLKKIIDELDELQRILYAHDRYSVLLIFQAMDAAGKDGTIRAVMSGVNPAGCQVFSFKQPSPEELDHDFLWRTNRRLPERGRIGIFNRSYYEETLIVRVHPELLAYQKLPGKMDEKTIWKERFESIRDLEKHLARNGTIILKFWLNVSKREQRERFLARLETPEKNWKFSDGDVKERRYWDDYMAAYEKNLNKTAAPWAPWYAIPADDKPFMRLCVAGIIAENLKKLDMNYPDVSEKTLATFGDMKKQLNKEE